MTSTVSDTAATGHGDGHGDAGYATAAATVVSLALALIATGVTGLALGDLRLARAELERSQAAARLDGGHFLAALRIGQNVNPGRIRWREEIPGGSAEILAEPEAAKLYVARAAGDGPGLLISLGAAEPYKTADWLKVQVASDHPEMLGLATDATVWKACAPSVLSYHGRAERAAPLSAAVAPDFTGQRWRAGEVWRVRVSSAGWVDDRIVRLTANGRRPAITILRRLARSDETGASGGEPCASLIR